VSPVPPVPPVPPVLPGSRASRVTAVVVGAAIFLFALPVVRAELFSGWFTDEVADGPRVMTPIEPAVSDTDDCIDGACFDALESCSTDGELCERDLEIARIAWTYFENNTQETGLVNAAHKYPSTTMWDVSSSLAGTLAAREIGLIEQKAFDDRIVALLKTLNTMDLYNEEAPNKAYDTKTAEMTDYRNNASQIGIGFSVLDLARLMSWLDLLSCMHPKHAHTARNVMRRWTWCNMFDPRQMYGAHQSKDGVKYLQEGRLGYEQYAAKLFERAGVNQTIADLYRNRHAQTVSIYGVDVPYDIRDPRAMGAINYVVTESFALDAMELGFDDENRALVRAIYDVQKRRWEETGIPTAVSEDNLDRSPYFLYNTIYAAGTPWNTISDKGERYPWLRSISTKAAFSLAALYPDDPYSQVLTDAVESAYDPERGWYSGIYESGIGYNKAVTANTNGIILEGLLYKLRGSLHGSCESCGHDFSIRTPEDDAYPREAEEQCFPEGP